MNTDYSAFSAGAFSDPELCLGLLERLRAELDRPLRFMEVCGTHTVAIFRSGLRSLLPEGITHLSGPGCPVCVTHDREIAACLELAARPGVILATFGDLMRVPGPGGRTLKDIQAEGGRIQVVYSPLDALRTARDNPDAQVVFLGVGFETTAPTVAAVMQMAAREALPNFSVLAFHKLVPPALAALLTEEQSVPPGESGGGTDSPNAGNDSPLEGGGIDAFLLPGHVSTILGLAPYRFIADAFGKPGVVGGFDPADILQSLLLMVRMRKENRPDILNQYSRAVADAGNPRAREILFEVFAPADALWRGIGEIPASGLTIRPVYAAYDARARFGLSLPEVPEIRGCRCGEVLRGRMSPDACPLFGRACTPARPVGPCMVSTEGSCAAYFKYQVEAPA